jgi:hypothetical protein
VPKLLGPNFWTILVVGIVYGAALSNFVPLSAIIRALAPHGVGSAVAGTSHSSSSTPNRTVSWSASHPSRVGTATGLAPTRSRSSPRLIPAAMSALFDQRPVDGQPARPPMSVRATNEMWALVDAVGLLEARTKQHQQLPRASHRVRAVLGR